MKQKLMKTMIDLLARHWLLASIAGLGAITAASLAPLPQLPSMSGGDKIHHLIAYGLLAIPVVLRKPRNWSLIILFFVAWSGVIELVQPYVHRYAEWADLLANCAGLSLGIVCAISLRRVASCQS